MCNLQSLFEMNLSLHEKYITMVLSAVTFEELKIQGTVFYLKFNLVKDQIGLLNEEE